MTNISSMQSLYTRLEQAGVSRSYIQEYVLPSWWQRDMDSDPHLLLEGAGYIAKHLGIDLQALLRTEQGLSVRDTAATQFKLRHDITGQHVTWARAVSMRAAEMAAHAIPTSFQWKNMEALAIRTAVLNTGAPWVGLKELLHFCWDQGIPVLPIADVPGKKMDGMAVLTEAGEPVIVINKSHNHPSWLLFILAHELGHLCRNHLQDHESRLDEDYNTASDEDDECENEANRFAVELITGDPETIVSEDRYPSAAKLAQAAMHVGQREQIDPGALVLNLAFHAPNNLWALANAALNELHDGPSGHEQIRSILRERLPWSNLPDESAQFLMRVTGCGSVDHPHPVAA